MGVVYRARQKGLERHVALKILPAGEHAPEDLVERFFHEARAAAMADMERAGRVCRNIFDVDLFAFAKVAIAIGSADFKDLADL